MKLFVVATPIGNLGDISERARNILSSTKLVFAEDTRVASKLLSHVGSRATVLSVHQHTTGRAMANALHELEKADDAALVTDAGTPGISDPGNKFIAFLLRAAPDVTITPAPGPSAFVAALSVCGFPTDRFTFMGFPPHKNKRQKFFSDVARTEHAVVFYESVHRIRKALHELSLAIGERKIMIGREITKLHETFYRGTAAQILEQLAHPQIKGEFVIVVGPVKS